MLSFLSDSFELFFPFSCLVCKRKTRGARLCISCTPKISDYFKVSRCAICFDESCSLDSLGQCENCRITPSIFSSSRYLWKYESEAANIITTMKYKPSPELAKVIGNHIAANFHLLYDYPYDRWDLLVPMPSSSISLRTRCFNQCYIIADKVHKRLSNKCKLETEALLHAGYKYQQVSLSHEKRLKNVSNAFKANEKIVKGQHILLLDDVMTTGATTYYAAKTLIDAGAYKVDLLTAARAKTWQEYREFFSKL